MRRREFPMGLLLASAPQSVRAEKGGSSTPDPVIPMAGPHLPVYRRVPPDIPI
jgi:hypothetical protein